VRRIARIVPRSQAGLRRAAVAGGAWATVLTLLYLRGTPIADGDMGWHRATGRWTATTGRIPTTDPFSWTAAGQPWVNQEWLGNLLLWAAYRVAGQAGPLALVAALAAAASLGTNRLGRLRGGSPAASAVLAGVAVGELLFLTTVRPQVFSWLGSVLVALGVEGTIRRDQGWRRLGLLIPGMVLWAQLHGAYLYGVGLVAWYGLVLVGSPGTTPGGVPWRRRGLRLLGLAAALELAVGLNPNGPALWAYPLAGLTSSANSQWMSEWQSPDFHADNWFWLFALLAGLVGALGGTAGILGRRQAGLGGGQWLTALGASAAGPGGRAAWGFLGWSLLGTLYQQRHVPLIFLVGIPVLAPLVDVGLAQFPAWRRRLPGRAWAAGAIGLVVLYGAARVSLAGGGSGLVPYWNNSIYYPTQALANPQVQALLRDPAHRALNYYTWGGYLIWEGIRPAIDGRQYVYGEPALEQYVRLTRLGPGWRQVLDGQGIDLVFYPTEAALTGALSDRPEWQVVYADPVVTLYQRRPAAAGPPTR
jgi:hypothetical protein